MGFLDHSTNNIIVDAVLTDKGRQNLAASLFDVAYFCLGDDEIDYTIIQQFGRNVGKEKIEKNTPIFEAFTQSNLGQKYKLTSINNETLTHLPVITADTTNNLISFNRSNKTNSTSISLTIKNTQDDTQIPFQVGDDFVHVEIDRKFLSLSGVSAPFATSKNNISTYRINTTRDNRSQISGKINIDLRSISRKDFNKYSIPSGQYIRTFVRITGPKSGLQKIIEVRIS